MQDFAPRQILVQNSQQGQVKSVNSLRHATKAVRHPMGKKETGVSTALMVSNFLVTIMT